MLNPTPGESHLIPTSSAGQAPVLLVHATPRERPAVRERLARLGAAVTVAPDIAEAMRVLTERRFALCLIDLADDRAAVTAVRVLRAVHPALSLVGMIDPASPVVAAEAMHAGLGDLLPWPFDERDFVAMLANAREASTIDPAGLPAGRAEALFAHSPLMRQVLEAVRAAAATRQGVLICGEEGTGRELVARTIHQTAGGSPDTFVRVDCAQVSGQGVEEALFGPRHLHDQDRPAAGVDCLSPEAAISRARGGTLFLVHLAELPARIQIRLSKLLRDREAAVGGGEPVEIDVRPIGAMEPDVDAAVADGRVRRDLIDRLSGARIDVPPLRDRRADIPLLAVSFARRLCGRDGIPPKRFSRSALALLSALPWHGNARELRELILGVLRSIRRPVIQLDDVLEHARLDGASARIQPGVTLRDARARFERECISAVLIRHHGRVGEAAKALGIQRTNLYRKVRQLNVARSLLSTRR